MKKGFLSKYYTDTGRLLFDASKIVLGSVIVAPLVKNDFSFYYDGEMILIGVAAFVVIAISGIVLMNINK
ncbi:hypothetical protein FACS189456_5800 [Bacteroidia bacterium]|nr:hypothetical protein FACS189456_5800 [Bacteroidia bacterium]